jgi:hypothetical protein
MAQPLASNYAIPRRPAAQQPPAEASPPPPGLIPHAEQEHRRQAEHQLPAAQSRDDYYGPALGTACQGCGSTGHTPDTCPFQPHPARHKTLDFHDTGAGRAMMREGAGTHLVGITSHEVVWDEATMKWQECEAIQQWRQNIERARARIAARASSSAAGTPNRPAPKTSSYPTRGPAKGGHHQAARGHKQHDRR